MSTQTVPVEKSTLMQFGKSYLDWAFVCGLIAMLPILFLQAKILWEKQHLQFFPIAWAGFVAIVYFRGSVSTTSTLPRATLGWIAFVGSTLIFLLSILSFSPWLCQIAAFAITFAWLVLRQAQTPFHTILHWMTLLIITLPLPFNLDERLIKDLQLTSSNSASAILDLAGVLHLQSGNVLEIRTGKLFVDRACSGVGSLYALAAITLALQVFHRVGGLVATLSLVSVYLWAWFGNVVRLTTIALVFDRFEVDWTKGWQHTTVGLVTFGISFAFLMISLELLRMFFRPIAIRQNKNFAHTAYNWAVKWPYASASTEGDVKPQATSNHKSYGIVLASTFVILGLVSAGPLMGIGPWGKQVVTPPHIDRGIIETLFASESLSGRLPAFKFQRFEVSQRERDDIFGEFSATWSFADSQGQAVQVSLDMPFAEFHQLEECYVLSGNQQIGGPFVEERTTDFGSQYVRHSTFEDQFGERSHLWYIEFTQSGKSVRALTRWERMVPTYSTDPLFQLQLLVRAGATEVSDESKALYEESLLQAFKELLPVIQKLKQ